METISATDASNKFGALLDKARLEPVKIKKQGRDVAVMLSSEEFKRMEYQLEIIQHERLKEASRQAEAGEVLSSQEALNRLEKRYS